MRITAATRLILALTIGLGVFACAATGGQASLSTQSDALQSQLDDLTRALARLQTAKPADQPQLMQDYWGMLQRQLNYVRLMPGVERRDCQDWMMVDPRISGGVPARAVVTCPTMHDANPAGGWELPAGMTPRLFGLTMTQQLDMLRVQVNAINAEPDADKRMQRLRDYYDSRYQDIQTVLGRGWMWTARDTVTLPDARSLGAELLGKYCSQCHSAPPPELHTRGEWTLITHNMRDIIQGESRKEVMGINMPTPDEFGMIASYLEAHAHGD